MSTISICPKCHGAVVPTSSSYVGKHCTCARRGSESASTATATLSSGDSGAGALTGAGVAVAKKLCCKCGADVTHERRMKDHLGRYWCYECGAADQAKRGQGVSMICPDCQKHFRPTHMIKDGEGYVCEACHTARQKHHGFLGLGRKSGQKQSSGLAGILLILLLLGAVTALGMYAMDMFP